MNTKPCAYKNEDLYEQMIRRDFIIGALAFLLGVSLLANAVLIWWAKHSIVTG